MRPEQIDHLAEHGWVAIEHFFSDEAAAMLLAQAHDLVAQGKFEAASIRDGGAKQVEKSIRRDSIYWIDDWQHPAIKTYGVIIRELGQRLSQELRTTIKCFEGHLGHYRVGDFYLKHLDQHPATRHRQISFITYLSEPQGGELVIYNKNNRNQVDATITPKPGTLVLLLSPLIFHEVKAAATDRFSLTGWFRDDADLFGDYLSV